jgi:hypothetical protein
MKSTKCPQCGLVYWSTDPNCKRCGLATTDESAPGFEAPQQEHQYQPAYSAQPAPVVDYAQDAVNAKLLKNLKADSIFFYVIGGIQIVVWFVLGHLMIVDGVLNITLSFLVYKFKSRVAALFLLGLTLLAILGAVVAMAAGSRTGWLFPIGLIIRLHASIRMVNAAFKLQGYVKESAPLALPPPPPNFYPETAPQYAE